MREICSKDHRQTGGFIGVDQYEFLKENYLKKFGIEDHITIRKEVVETVIRENPGLYGIRFTYGTKDLENGNNKFLILVPCFTNQDSNTLIPFINPDGYLTDEGIRLSLLETWEGMNNHVVFTRSGEPYLSIRQVHRACFFGIDQINKLLSIEGISCIRYHFGYDTDATIDHIPSRYKIILEPLDLRKNSFHIYMDLGEINPPKTPPDDGSTCLMTSVIQKADPSKLAELDLFRKYRDNVLINDEAGGSIIEMYYHISPTLIERIDQRPDKEALYADLYQQYASKGKSLIETNDTQQAKAFFEMLMRQMMHRFLLN